MNVEDTQKKPEDTYPQTLKGFAQVLDAARLGAWELELASGNIKRSLQHDRIYGYDSLQPTWTWDDSIRHIRSLDLAVVKRTYLEALKTGQWQVEFFINRTDGALRWVAVVASVLYDDEGNPERLVGVISDATDREHAAFGWRERLERKNALERSESALRETERFTETVLNSVTDGVAVYDTELRYVAWNRTLQQVTGISADEVIGRSVLEVFPETKKDGIDLLLKRALKGENVRSGDRSFVMPSTGEEIWVQSAFGPHFNADGEIIGVVGIIYDVTERRVAQENLLKLKSEEIAHAQAEEARRRISMILESITDAFFTIDNDYRFMYVNPRAAEYLNRSVDDIIGRDLRELFPEVLKHEDYHYLTDAMQSREPVKFESRLPDDKGWLAFRIYPSGDDGLSVYYHDLTQQKLAQDRLRASEERFRGVVENSPDVIVVIEPNGDINYASPSAEALLGYTPEELEQRNLFKKFPSEAAHKLRNTLLVLLYEPEKMISLELEVARKNGQDIYLDVRARNLLVSPTARGDTDLPPYVLLTMRDVTETKLHHDQLVEARQKAEQMNQLKSSLLANMSHELHTPLTSLLAQANLLTKSIPEEYHEALSRIERGARRLADTFNSVLALAQLEGSALVIDRESFDLIHEVQDIAKEHEKAAARKGLKLQVHTRQNEVMVYTDPLYISRILNNLLENAIKFTDAGEVNVEVSKQDGQVEIVVSDTGIGISETFLPQLFGEFEQESTGLSRSHEGSGLGLAITKRMIEGLKGTIDVESEPGVGSTFRVSFPAYVNESERKQRTTRPLPAQPEAAERRIAKRTGEGQGERKSRLLLVEDNEDIRPLLEQLLTKIGDVDAFSNAEAALECAAKKSYDLVLMDISLPKMSGLDAMRQLRNMHEYDSVAMIAMTGHAIPGDRERFLRAGFDAYIAKPFAPSDLVSMVEAWI